jgi:hypothetical protein
VDLLPAEIAKMPGDLLRPTLTHPRQQKPILDIAMLLNALRSCETPEELFEMQRNLFYQVLDTQGRIATLRRAMKRTASGKPLDDDLVFEYEQFRELAAGPTVIQLVRLLRPSSTGRVPDADQHAWLHLEEMVSRRGDLHMRAVGDALAWEVFRFDRPYVHMLCRNERTGPITTGKSPDTHGGRLFRSTRWSTCGGPRYQVRAGLGVGLVHPAL